MVHLSVDDVQTSLAYLLNDSSRYNSCFEDPFFNYLKQLHNKYGACFTLYIYKDAAVNGGGNYQLMRELSKESSWLKFGFHASTPGQKKEQISDFSSFTSDYLQCIDLITGFASEKSVSHLLRLEYFFSTPEEAQFLYANGVSCLLTADDDRISYSNSAHKQLKTDFRIENVSVPEWELAKRFDDDSLVIFTHENCLYEKVYRDKLEKTIRLIQKQSPIKYICE